MPQRKLCVHNCKLPDNQLKLILANLIPASLHLLILQNIAQIFIGPISAALFYALMMVESGGDLNAVGDGGRAIGPYQIHEVYWKDAAQYDPTLTNGGKNYQNCKGPGSREYSERVMQVYVVTM